ncbi:hypothetical protein [Arthrobacter sp. A5]
MPFKTCRQCMVLRTRPAAAGTVIRISGTAMVAIGAFLLAEQLVH